MDYIVLIATIIIIVSVFLYDTVWRVNKCNEKIIEHVKNKAGEILSIEKLSPRTEAYVVKYKIDGEIISETVKFSFFYNEEWY